jgi:two-component system cell cycle response regulator DivK
MTTSRAALPRSVSPKLVLLVDYDSDNRGMYAEFLRFDAWHVEEAIVITDTRLAGMSGYELCQWLRRDPTTHDIPIIVVTADAFPDDVRRAKEAGADLVLTKPCLPEKLSDAAQQLLAASAKSHRK